MESERIERQYKDEQELYQYLMSSNEISFASYIDNVYKKVLLLSAASFFETEISECVVEFARKAAKVDPRVSILVEKKAIARQYHTLFQWESKNTNSFWSLFGEDTKKKVRKIVDESEKMKKAEDDFLEIGHRRNLLVHENFSEFDVNLTVEDIYKLYKSACIFVEFIPEALNPFFLNSR